MPTIEVDIDALMARNAANEQALTDLRTAHQRLRREHEGALRALRELEATHGAWCLERSGS
jgi:hypothetical protein